MFGIDHEISEFWSETSENGKSADEDEPIEPAPIVLISIAVNSARVTSLSGLNVPSS